MVPTQGRPNEIKIPELRVECEHNCLDALTCSQSLCLYLECSSGVLTVLGLQPASNLANPRTPLRAKVAATAASRGPAALGSAGGLPSAERVGAADARLSRVRGIQDDPNDWGVSAPDQALFEEFRGTVFSTRGELIL